MTEKRTVRLVVEMPDPGESCNGCEMLTDGGICMVCRLGFAVNSAPVHHRGVMLYRRPRPAECRAAEVTP